MEKAHEVGNVLIIGTLMKLEVDGQEYEVDLAKESELFAKATPQARAHFEISSSGYGIHWPEIDEDLSIDGLIGVRHSFPLWESSR